VLLRNYLRWQRSEADMIATTKAPAQTGQHRQPLEHPGD